MDRSQAKLTTLLDWATKNTPNDVSDGQHATPKPTEKLVPELVDMILGKPDAVRMKEALAIAVDEARPESARVQALDDLELLIESLDNANGKYVHNGRRSMLTRQFTLGPDLEVLKMWEPLLTLASSPSNDISMNALWVIGTAIQNNPKSQAAFLSHDPFPAILSALSRGTTPEVRAKAMYCISGALKHSRAGVLKFTQADGWGALKTALSGSSPVVRRKIAFLLNALLIPHDEALTDSTTENDRSPFETSDVVRIGITDAGLIQTLTSSLTSTSSTEIESRDEDYEEKAVRATVTYLQNDGRVAKADAAIKDDIRTILRERGSERGRGWGLDEQDWETLENFITASSPS
ncbi:hsp70 nucleotide exchange factor fes1 [Tulasnella sp. 403]|nr:hsp70 nucleotide exchange factor fes1 [Tulasnella sp. 403]